MKLFRGKLTYTLAALAIVYGALGFFLGWLEQEAALNVIWIGLAAFGLRRAVT